MMVMEAKCIENQCRAVEPNIIGEWSMSYFMQDVYDGQISSDPRWMLKVTFGEDKKFICDSRSVQEKRLSGGGTQEVENKIFLEGTFESRGGTIDIRFTKDLNDDEKEIARVNLGYDDNWKGAAVDVSFQPSTYLLILRGVHSKRAIFFKNNSRGHNI